MTEASAMKYLLPPYRCCGVSTRKSRRGHSICDICAWSYNKRGERVIKATNIKKHDRTEIDK